MDMKLTPQQAKVMEWLRQHGTIDSRTAAMELYILDLPKRISELTRLGIEFDKARSGKVTRYKLREAS